MHFKFISCVAPDGRKFKANETWEDPENIYWFECQEDGQYLQEKVRGCVSHDKTRRVKLGESYDFGNFTYKCSMKDNGTLSMCSVGCIHNEAHYEIGEQWADGEYLYYCKKTGPRTQKVFIGCQFGGKKLYDGDRFQKGSTVYECDVMLDHFAHKPVACVYKDELGDSLERVIGCRWYQTIGSTKVERTCIQKPNEDVTTIQSLGCVYEHNGHDTLFIYPDSYTIWTVPDTQKVLAVACKKNLDDGEIYLETFGIDDISRLARGLRYDSPHGV